jgi:hypothetical protein
MRARSDPEVSQVVPGINGQRGRGGGRERAEARSDPILTYRNKLLHLALLHALLELALLIGVESPQSVRARKYGQWLGQFNSAEVLDLDMAYT